MTQCVRITFYGREEYLDLPADSEGYAALLDAARRLASRQRGDVTAFYRLNVSNELAAVVAIGEIQAVVFVEDMPDVPDTATIVNGTRLMTDPGAALYLKGRRQPVVLKNIRGGPLDDMVIELTSTRYGEVDMGCVMLADEKDNPVFLVLDELQYALFSRELLDT